MGYGEKRGSPLKLSVDVVEGGRVDLVQGEDHTPAHDLDGTLRAYGESVIPALRDAPGTVPEPSTP